MALAILTLASVTLPMGALLLVVHRFFQRDDGELVEKIESILPRIQCAQCGYPGCLPYARAIAEQGAEINLCPPGGQDTVNRLAGLLARDPVKVSQQGNASLDKQALIDESVCIGCGWCLSKCPVDAIVGSPQFMHTVLVEDCTGCELCVPACPVECISLVDRHA